MMKRFLFLALFGAATFSLSSNADIIIAVDTATELQGTFSLTGFDFSSAGPVQFAGLLPGNSSQQQVFVQVVSGAFVGDEVARVGTRMPGQPSWALLTLDLKGSPVSGSLSGSYNNNPLGKVVDFLLSASDTGTAAGTFSGSFSFKLHETPSGRVPEGGSTAALLGSAILGITGLRRRFGLRPQRISL